MKKVFTLAVACMVTLLSVANDHPRDGRLRVANHSRQHISVMVDGRYVRDFDDNFMIGLSPGRHDIRIYRHGNRNRMKGRLVYRNTIHVQPMEEVRMIIRRDGKVWVDEKGRNDRRRRGYHDRYDRRGDDGRYDRQYDRRFPH